MPKELPIEYPIQRKEERLIISVLFVFLLLLTAGYFRLTPSRKSLIAKIPSWYWQRMATDSLAHSAKRVASAHGRQATRSVLSRQL